MMRQLLLRINDLLKTDEVSFSKKLIELENWAESLNCSCSKEFCKELLLSLKNNKMELVQTKRLIRKYKKKIKKEISIRKECFNETESL